jgi:hypothetical protein
MIAAFSKLIGPDLIVIAIILLVLVGIPVAIALPIVFLIDRRSKKRPPPLPEAETGKERYCSL